MRLITREEFIRRSEKVQGIGTIDYSLVEKLQGTHKKVPLICLRNPDHGIFYQSPDNNLQGKKCAKCANEILTESKKYTKEEFITQSNLVHGEGTYTYECLDYIDGRVKVKINCPIHGIFEQRPSTHLMGHGCPGAGCGGNKPLTKEDFVERSILVHGEKYGYSKFVYVNYFTASIITCYDHGDFIQKPSNHISGNGCPHCQESKGERAIREWLVINNIEFEPQHSYKDLVGGYKRPLEFDFYIPYLNLLIEFDGKQHYMPVCFGGISKERAVTAYIKTKENDTLKDKYCLGHNIPLLRISYKDKKKIPEILIKNILGINNNLLINT